MGNKTNGVSPLELCAKQSMRSLAQCVFAIVVACADFTFIVASAVDQWPKCKSGACCNPHTAVRQYCPGGIKCQECGGGEACQCPDSDCSPYTTCSSCTSHSGWSGDCFWCSEDKSCHDHGSVEYPASCTDGGCASNSSITTCTGSCGRQPVPSGFNVAQALCLASVSSTAYTSGSIEIREQLAAVGVTLVSVFDYALNDTQGLVGVVPSANAVVLAFRGTELSIANGALDIDITLVQFSSIGATGAPETWELCNGFANAYAGLRVAVYAALKQALMSVGALPTLYVTGHSLGAAMATVAAADISLSTTAGSFGSIVPFTFAAPRAGNPGFAYGFDGNLESKTWAVQEWFDQVPHLPPHDLGYLHVMRLVVVGPNSGNIVKVTTATDDDHFNLAKDPIDFHHIAVYITSLASLTGAPERVECGDVLGSVNADVSGAVWL